MKLAIVTHNVIKGDGQGRVNYELTRRLLQRGVDVDLVADKVAPELLDRGASWVPVHPSVDGIDLVKVWQFRHMANRRLKDIAHRYDAILACGVVCNRPHALNAVHFVHGTWLRSPFHASKVQAGINSWYQWVFSKLNARWERQTFAQADRVVAVSEMVRQELVDIGVPKEKLEVIMNGVDLEEFAPGPVCREKLGLPEHVTLGLFVGDIRSPIKNLDTVLRALLRVPEMHLAVAGTVDQSPYPALAEELGVADRVHFLGFRKDIADLMRASDLFILISRYDSFSLVLLEAMASALPVVTARTVGAADLVNESCSFVLQRPDDMATLVRGLRVLTEDSARRKEMGQSARAVAEAHSWEKMTDRYLHLVRERVS